ncbi:D-alanyl-D-alanine carboxypeptidase/D-alanyl-D-alanine-endopeptidase [Loktanella agnita]|uniref:D-alanyl-D-alanine carboxypeptidase/D-alanyl-D-alanine endopeptidase n=1 Tax=Loktanella agnita TaxID=287097 RepID=UPI00398869B8
MRLTRRGMIMGAASTLATGAAAEPLATSLRPVARNMTVGWSARKIARARLSGDVGFVIADAQTGEVLEAVAPDMPLPPASVAKTFTSLYAIETLGQGHRFTTRVLADGPIYNGILHGNLILAGGGDPNLVTDDLAVLCSAMKDSGLHEVKGDFLVWDNALVNLDEIDTTQLDYLGYNPSVTGLNLNFNRVHFEWKRQEEEIVTVLDARSARYKPVVTTSRMEVVDRPHPVFTYRDAGEVDEWTVAQRFLNDAGSRWLPVRHPALYAGEVFATFARSHGIILKQPQEIADVPDGRVLAAYDSAPLTDMLRGLLDYSTNITAEAVGLAATVARTGQHRGLHTSAMGMARWASSRVDGIAPYFVDHSGLGDGSRVAARDMVRLLVAPDVRPALHPILKDIPWLGQNGAAQRPQDGQLRAKTGTLNFVCGLAGYLRTAGGRDLAFAMFAADLAAREEGIRRGGERPPGARRWNTAARNLQRELLQHWARAV